VNLGGTVTFIHRFDRGGEVASLLAAAGADATLFPLYPRREAQPNRVLIQGAPAGGGHVRSGRGLILHEPDGRYTTEAEAILRHGHALSISPS
jgi:tRNA1(Val) A37 N6-methylase TrmN6